MFNSIFFTGGVSPSPLATEKGLAKGEITGPSSATILPPLHHETEQAQNLPPLNHGIEMAGALPPLNHNIQSASNLPPLNHGKEEAANLPPLLHGVEQAGNLPPLNHGNDALQSFHSLPPLNHGTEQAGNLPPLNHGIESNGLPPLNHANEQAGILPPLLHGVEQAGHAPPSLSDFEKASSQNVDALSAFTSQVNNALGNNGKQSSKQSSLDLNGVEKDSVVTPKTYGDAGKTNTLIPDAKQSFINNGNDLLRNYYSTRPVVQGKEFIDAQPFAPKVSNEAVDSIFSKTTALQQSDENPQSKDSVPFSYDNKKELQNLLAADRMSQGTTTSTSAAYFRNQEPSGKTVMSDICSDFA